MKDWTGNTKTVYSIIGASNHSEQERQEYDFYATDPETINKLQEKFDIPKNIYEISAGNGHLAQRLKDLGHNVICNDIIQRKYSLDSVKDFLTFDKIPDNYSILTNPPYKYAEKFVLKSLDLLSDNNYCIMFLKLTFLEGKSRLKNLYSKYPPKFLFVAFI